jgi:hypothetical protein
MPSFKRLPSQTLGPANAKWAQHSRAHDDGGNEREREHGRGIGDVDNGDGPLRSTGDGNLGNIIKMLSGSNMGDVGAAMDRRRRRMSLPTATMGVPASVVPS